MIESFWTCSMLHMKTEPFTKIVRCRNRPVENMLVEGMSAFHLKTNAFTFVKLYFGLFMPSWDK